MSQPIDVRNPRTGQVDYWITPLGFEEMSDHAARLRAAQAKWVEIGLEDRVRAMEALCDAVDRHYDAILDALCADTGRHEWSVNEIEGLKGRYVSLAADVPDLEALSAGRVPRAWDPLETTTTEEVTFLSPLDPVVADRNRTQIWIKDQSSNRIHDTFK